MYTVSRRLGYRRLTLAFVLTCLWHPGDTFADVFEPFVLGVVFENAPFDGFGDQIDPGSGRLIGNVNGTRQSVVMEFDISSVPLGFVNASAFKARIVPNNSNNTGTRTHRMIVYPGDGIIGLDDYSAAGIEIGSVSHPSGGSSNVNLDMAYAFQSLLNAGASHLGIRIEPVNEPQGWDVISIPPFDPLEIQAFFGPLGVGVSNGDFQTGDLTAWQTFITHNGNITPGLPLVEPFDVDGDGLLSDAVKFRVGQTVFDHTTTAGGGISQRFLVQVPGDYSLTVDVASFNDDFTGNTGPGRYDLIMDGVILDTLHLNGTLINPGQTIRGSLQAPLTNLSAGTHALEVLVTRSATNSRDVFLYFDNILLTKLLLDGDLNGDGFVGIADLNLILGNWNASVTPGDPFSGDPSGNGFVGIQDHNTVLGNWNAGTPPPAEALTSIPEPGSLTLLVVMAVSASHRRR